ncbi:MAG: UDP-N-acetylmuramoyl-tripeptide--D-alanyl-D-alanine ligase [Elusimicrobia bacterium]|nr:UDP-N-acetylmuramoyl-tripeptide--D-alanyl-D-alanine ligase [Elusimicrobiota bacterium]
MTWAELARGAGGLLTHGGAQDLVDCLSTDTRSLKTGQAFWALKGPRFDAHDLLSPELARVCPGWVIEKDRLPDSAPRPAHVVEVPNTLKALAALAAQHRRRFDIPVVGITGSNGKTTTKEMLKSICLQVGPSCANPGNWNNQVGVPLSVLELGCEHRYGIFELADSRPGDIAEVARVAQPSLAVLTNIGPDHLEFYGSLDQNFKTKSELVESLPEEGRAVINIDDRWLAGLEPRLGARAITFGMSPRARIYFAGPDELVVDRHKTRVRLRAFGTLSRYNAAAAAAAAWALGIDAEKIRLGLESYVPSAMRLERLSHPSGSEIVLDAYNANPASMRAAVEAFCDEFKSRDKILVLGDMKELGPQSGAFHAELGEWLAELPLAGVYLAGPEMAAARIALERKAPGFAFRYALDPLAWTDDLRRRLDARTAVFFKASRVMKFESILDSLSCSIT